MAGAAVEFNDLLGKEGIDPKTVLVLRHRPRERELRKVLPWLAAERPDTYNAYQQQQSPSVETAMVKADDVASFIGHEAGKALFIALYHRGQWHPLTHDDYWRVPANIEMRDFGMRGPSRESILCRCSSGASSVLQYSFLALFAASEVRLIATVRRQKLRWRGHRISGGKHEYNPNFFRE
jgi:hypothetical protein